MSDTYELDITNYSEMIAGDKGNYDWAVRFDNTGPHNHDQGYIGITQYDGHGKLKERVLLSPDQVQAFRKFLYKARKP